MIKCVCHPLFTVSPGIASKPWAKSIPNNPNAGINTRNPTPAERCSVNGL